MANGRENSLVNSSEKRKRRREADEKETIITLPRKLGKGRERGRDCFWDSYFFFFFPYSMSRPVFGAAAAAAPTEYWYYSTTSKGSSRLVV